MNKEKILPIVRKIRDRGSNFRYETCETRLLPSFVTISRRIFSFYFARYFLRIVQVNKEKILSIVTSPIVTRDGYYWKGNLRP